MNSAIMDTKEVADYLRVHVSTVYRLVKRRRIPYFRLNSDLRFVKAKIDAWMDSQPTTKETH